MVRIPYGQMQESIRARVKALKLEEEAQRKAAESATPLFLPRPAFVKPTDRLLSAPNLEVFEASLSTHNDLGWRCVSPIELAADEHTVYCWIRRG
jgi:hypothetical protein